MQAYQGQYLSAYLHDRIASIEQTIQAATDEQLTNESEISYVESLVDKFVIHPLQLHLVSS